MKKKILLCIFLSILILLSLSILAFLIHSVSISKHNLTFEYGQEIRIKEKDIFTSPIISPRDVKADISALPLEKGKNYPKIGTYSIPTSYYAGPIAKSETIKITIKDTKKPVFIKYKETLTIEQGNEEYDFLSSFKASDLSKTTLSIDTGKIDFQKPGTYTAVVQAIDNSHNKTELKVKVIVKEKTKQIINEKKPDNTKPVNIPVSIESILNRYNGTISICYKNLMNNDTYTYNDINFYPCSIIKLCVLLTVYDQANKGLVNLTECQSYLNNMIINSDNNAYNTLLKILGQGNGINGLSVVNTYLASIGITRTQLHHALQPADEYFDDGAMNISCVSDIGKIFEKLYKNEILSSSQNEEIISLLTQCADTKAIWQGLPPNVQFAHKTGYAYNLYLDGGIVYSPDKDYILVVFTDNVSSRSDFFYEISNYFYYQ